MAVDPDDVIAWLGGADAMAGVDTDVLTRVCAAVDDWAGRHYDLTDPTDEHDQALIQEAGRRYQRKHSPDGLSGTDDLAVIRVPTYDREVLNALSGRLKTAGLFGPSANVVVEE